jgi:hypothetical protein
MIAKVIVTNNPVIVSNLYPPTKAACDQVNAAPEVNNKIVFNNGINHGFMVSIPFGGQTLPISATGFKLL